MDEETYYQVLEIDESATDEQVKESYRCLVKQYHPDEHYDKPSASKYLEERFKQIQEAYEVLKDRKKRRQYDALLKDLRDHGNGNTAAPGGSAPNAQQQQQQQQSQQQTSSGQQHQQQSSSGQQQQQQSRQQASSGQQYQQQSPSGQQQQQKRQQQQSQQASPSHNKKAKIKFAVILMLVFLVLISMHYIGSDNASQDSSSNTSASAEDYVKAIGELVQLRKYSEANAVLSKLDKKAIDYGDLCGASTKNLAWYRATINQKLGNVERILSNNTFILKGEVTEKHEMGGSGGYWGFVLTADDGKKYGFGTNCYEPLYFRVDGKDIEYMDGYKKLKDTYSFVSVVVNASSREYLMTKNTGDDPVSSGVMPVGVLFSTKAPSRPTKVPTISRLGNRALDSETAKAIEREKHIFRTGRIPE